MLYRPQSLSCCSCRTGVLPARTVCVCHRYVPVHDAQFDEYLMTLSEHAEEPKFSAGYHKGAKQPPKSVAGKCCHCCMHAGVAALQMQLLPSRHSAASLFSQLAAWLLHAHQQTAGCMRRHRQAQAQAAARRAAADPQQAGPGEKLLLLEQASSGAIRRSSQHAGLDML